MRRFIHHILQLLRPAEFRIPSPVWPPGLEDGLMKLVETNAAASAPATEEDKEAVQRQRQEQDRRKFLAEVATAVWKLKGRMIEKGTGVPKEAFRREYRHVEALQDAITRAGVEVQDHTGRPFDEGMALNVLTYQPTPGVVRKRVQETLKPSVYLDGKTIQMGEVIVETPERPAADAGPQASMPESAVVAADSSKPAGARSDAVSPKAETPPA